MADKMSVHICFQLMLEDARRLLGQEAKIFELRLDNGTEYLTEGMKRIIEKEKITCVKTPTYTSNLNGSAERFNRELQEKMRCMILDNGIPKTMWAFALKFALRVYNNTPCSSINFDIPFEKLTNKKSVIKYFRRFGCLCYVLNHVHQSKLDSRGRENFLVGCEDTHYLTLDPSNSKVTKSKHVSFVESRVYGHIYGKLRKLSTLGETTYKIAKVNNSTILKSPEDEVCDDLSDVRTHFTHLMEVMNNDYRQILSEKYTDVIESFIAGINDCPKSYDEATHNENSKDWNKVIKKELSSLERNETWEFVLRTTIPKGQRILTSRWVFTTKRETNDTTLYKACLVIRGYADSNEYVIQEIYAPVARLSNIKVLICIAVKFNFHIQHMDVTTAFLNGELEKEVFMEIPEGVKGVDKNQYVCTVKNALFGLKVSPKRWYRKFREQMEKFNFEVYPFQSCI